MHNQISIFNSDFFYVLQRWKHALYLHIFTIISRVLAICFLKLKKIKPKLLSSTFCNFWSIFQNISKTKDIFAIIPACSFFLPFLVCETYNEMTLWNDIVKKTNMNSKNSPRWCKNYHFIDIHKKMHSIFNFLLNVVLIFLCLLILEM